jgi:isoamylase
MVSVSKGIPPALGAECTSRGVNFAVYSSRATRVELCLFDPAGREMSRHELQASADNVWHIGLPAEIAGPGTVYAYRVQGPFEPHAGQRFDGSVYLVDPYAKALVPGTLLSRVVGASQFDWEADRPPATPWRNSVIYELHVKGFTRLHPDVPPARRGKYLGLAEPAVIEHLKRIGVTAVELLPCQAFLTEQFLRERGLTNYWGYNSIAWFAPADAYAVEDATAEFKCMVKALHRAGIEVILDVVFNHTAEGNEAGQTLSLRGFDNSTYYRLVRENPGLYENLTGCGNTVNCANEHVRRLIIDCLRYWVEEMHVDGFRFDLATVLARDDDGFNERSAFFKAIRSYSSLAYVKLIAEPWDVGLGGYQLGHFPADWAEWNDRYRDSVRAFWRGDSGTIGEFAERIAGSSDIFRYRARKPYASINFVTAHDGFTLHDLVSYNDRHNLANLENNADGHNHNLSWNCGVEGPTDDAAILSRRERQMKNILATLFFSQGVPMLQAGDEFGRTQGGNNNAYCQDNEISWLDWSLRESHSRLLQFVAQLAQLRRKHGEFRRDTFFKGSARHQRSKDVSWLHARGAEMSAEDWNDPYLRSLGVKLASATAEHGAFLLLMNAGETAEFVLPAAAEGRRWSCGTDTARSFDATGGRIDVSGESYLLVTGSLALLEY